MLARLAWAHVAAAGAFTLQALDPAVSVSQYHKQYWQVEQGLAHNYVYSIVAAPNAHLHIATAEGLVRFDGLTFSPLSTRPESLVSHRWISALLAGRNGSLWAGTFDGDLIEIQDGAVKARHALGGSIFDLIEDGEGAVWISTRNGVFRLAAAGIEKQNELRAPSETSWNVLFLDSIGQLWVVTRDGLFQRRGDHFIRYAANEPERGEILTAHRARNGVMWLGTSRGLYSITDRVGALPGVAGPIVALLEDQDGVLWAGSWGKGLYRINHDRVQHWSAAEDLPDDFIRTLAEDHEGNLWIGMRSGGLGRWRDTRILPHGTPEGLAGEYASVVARGPDGSLWLGTWRGGLYRLTGGVLQSQPLPLPRLYFTIRAIAFDWQNHLWIGNWEGLFEFDGRRYHRYGAETESPIHRVTALLFDRSRVLWVGTSNQGLLRFPGGRPATQPRNAMFPEFEITALMQSAAGDIWVGTTGGLYRILVDGQDPRSPAALPGRSVRSVFEDSRGRIWAAAAGALLVVTPRGSLVLDRNHGLPELSFYRIEEDTSGNFWVSSSRGLLELKAASVEQVLQGASQTLSWVSYDREDGLRTLECHGLSQPPGARAPDGSLWFPTSRGFIQVQPRMRRALPPPRVVFEGITGEGGMPVLTPEGELRRGARNIEIRFTALRFSTPGKVRFRYRLSGVDPDWVDAGNERKARYNQIPAGASRLEVQARDPWGDWGDSASIHLYQQPSVTQTWWFHLLTGLAAVAAVAAFYRWRLHAVRSRYAAILDERNRIGREWHDTLVAGFSAISLQIEAALAAIGSRPEQAAEILQVTRGMVHHYRAEARRVIQDLRENRPEGETLGAALEGALRRAIQQRPIQGSVVIEGQPCPIPAEIQHNILRICQEALANAVRHGDPGRIEVKVTYSPDAIRAIVQDDGCGFSVESAPTEGSGHFGITVMQERARRSGGRLSVESRPGRGTVVEAVIPIPGSSKK